MEESTGSEGQTESSSGGTPTSASSGGQACTLLDESIDIARLDALGPEDDFADVPCDVTGDGFLCTFDKDPELVDVDAVLEGFASVPWEPGQSVLIGGFGPLGSSYEASLAVESTNGGLLALIVWNRSSARKPFELQLEDVGCVDPESASVPLEATYSLDGDAVTLLGSGSAELGDYTVFQDTAADQSVVSAGEVGQSATFAIVLTP